MSNLVPGVSLTLRSLGNIEGPRFLDGRTGDASVGLAPSTDGPFTGTHWEVIDDGLNRVIFKCMGAVEGPRFLDGRTGDGSVGLAPGTDEPFTGTHWEVIDDGPNRVTLRCMGNIEGPRFLDGRTGNGTVGLVPGTDGPFTGAHWEIVNSTPVETQAFDSGSLTSDLPLGGSAHLVMRRNGDFTFSCHAHDSGFDNIDYVVSAALMTPSRIAFTFQHSGHVEGTIAGLPLGSPNRDDDFITGGNNTAIANEWGGILGASLVASVDGRDTLVGGLEELLKKVGKEAAVAAVVALV